MGGRRENLYFFRIFKEVEKSSKFYRGMYFWGSGGREREKGERIGFWVEEEKE